MQLVLERGSIDKPLTFDVGLIQLNIHTSVFTQYMQRCFQMLKHFSQIALRVCNLVLFIVLCNHPVYLVGMYVVLDRVLSFLSE